MALEIERKFLVLPGFNFKDMACQVHEISQAYVSADADRTVRVRRQDCEAFLTVKSRNRGAVRHEWEYGIPVADALEIMALPGVKALSKTRYIIPYDERSWEVDVFHGPLEGLVIAEIELSEENEQFELPPFVDREITGDPRYYNSNLASR